MLCLRYIQSYNVRHIEVYLPTFGYILVDSGIFRILAQLDMFMYIKAYSEPMDYSAIFRTVDIFSPFRHYSRAFNAYSEPYLSRFRHI